MVFFQGESFLDFTLWQVFTVFLAWDESLSLWKNGTYSFLPGDLTAW
jgi:hypothetical protein